MHQIEIDFEVFKALTNRRATEETTYNEVIREMLSLPNAPKSTVQSTANRRAWLVSNTSFPAGSLFMAEYKGNTHSGVVKDGKLELDDGSKFTSPSAAAVHIAGHNMNGWRFWKCKLPGASQFVLIERLRGRVHTA